MALFGAIGARALAALIRGPLKMAADLNGHRSRTERCCSITHLDPAKSKRINMPLITLSQKINEVEVDTNQIRAPAEKADFKFKFVI